MYDMDERLIEMLSFIIHQVSEEHLWDLWTRKDIDIGWEDFKKKNLRSKPVHMNQKVLTEEEEERIIKQAEDILNLTIDTSP